LKNSDIETWHLGIDDTDSENGMCTTYIGTLVVDLLLTIPVHFLDFPKLIRLNPNIPYKTRGNGAVAITFSTSEEQVTRLWNRITDLVLNNADLNDLNTDPGLILINGSVPKSFRELYRQALYQVVPFDQVKGNLTKASKSRYFCPKDGRGLIGAAAAIGADLSLDYTYELIVYRHPSQRKSKRLVDMDSIIRADRNTPQTFNNYDYVNRQVMITPHGPDPVFCGIRGETTESVVQMWEKIQALEPIQTVMVFRTNQHTQVHFPREFKGSELKPHLSVRVTGTVGTKPQDFPGGHVIFKMKSGHVLIDCAAYEPTKQFRKIIRELEEGDEIVVYGGVRPASNQIPMTINLEEIEIINLVMTYKRKTPKCPECGSTLTSAGRRQGFKCKRCSFDTPKKEYIYLPSNRKIRTGVRYIPPVCAHRHLTKPIVRDGRSQFRLSSNTNFSQAFSAFLEKRHQLISR
jgi:tRNA(Ile2)-agmatinylcytidine synthase